MRFVYLILIMLFQYCLASVDLLDKEIDLKNKIDCKSSEFCTSKLDEIDIEEYIEEIFSDENVIVSLDECVQVALYNNFDIAISNHQFLSSKYEYENRLSKFLPYLNTTSYISDYQGQILVGGILSDSFTETAISINVTLAHELTKGGEQIFEAKAAKYFEKSRKHNLYYTKTQTLYYCAKYYYELLLAKVNVEIYLRNLIERNLHLALVQNLKDTGFGTEFDVIRQKSKALSAKVDLLKELNNFTIAQSRLAEVMGIKLDTKLMPFEDEVKKVEFIEINKPLSELFDTALNLREDLKEYKDLIGYEKQKRNVYITEFFPKPLLNWQEQWQGTTGTSIRPNYILTAYMTWNLGQNMGIGTITKIKEQKEKIKIKQLEFDNKLRKIEQDLINELANAKFSAQEIDIAKKRLQYAQETIKLAIESLKNRKLYLDIIDAQTEVTKARKQYIKAIINYNISQLALMYYSGSITQQDIIKNYKP